MKSIKFLRVKVIPWISHKKLPVCGSFLLSLFYVYAIPCVSEYVICYMQTEKNYYNFLKKYTERQTHLSYIYTSIHMYKPTNVVCCLLVKNSFYIFLIEYAQLF